MYKPTVHLENQMILPDDFFLPFGGKLDKENRWVQLAKLVPWAHAEKNYGQFFKDTFRGQHTLSLRMGLGALIIQERMQLTDRETLASISENPYMQYFIGLAGFEMKPPFHHSMMTHFRKRLKDVLAEINEIVATEGAKEWKDDDEGDANGGGISSKRKRASKKSASSDTAEQQTMFDDAKAQAVKPAIPATTEQALAEQAQEWANEQASANEPLSTDRQELVTEAPLTPNAGTLLVDASCAPADVAYPTDLNLLNEAREKLEGIIDTLHEPVVGKATKPRTYREKARKQYLAVSKQRRPGPKVIRKAIRRQLGYVGRNLAIIAEQAKEQPLTLLSRKACRDLLVIHELYRQQLQMYNGRTHQIEDRIVSIHQPHVRPIVRGKAKARVEFGAKIAVSMTKGYAFLDRISWDNFNESTTLIEAIEKYRSRMGCYPAVVQADQIYRTRENRNFCKQHGIRLSGPALGRPPKDGQTNEQRHLAKQDAGERNAIEGKFGEGKRKYGLDRIRARLAQTSESVITLQLLVMNLERRLRVLFCFIFSILLRRRPTIIFR
ncbi:IS5 family transposase [Paenibacillus sp. JMULE4]|uniref:IS5 family transposase n=1 Tax=Paenibacillus sp. JMULE4 TaxID=2518342 RepID=UPI0015750380|nr:IS5 family transposase [Paenibacillus sp. JMULE4]NTZ20804.1 IS5 family transposase [Paenibacillus sp. JMULE4]